MLPLHEIPLHHRETGVPFALWLTDPSGPLMKDPISLLEIGTAVGRGFAITENWHWRTPMEHCISALLHHRGRTARYGARAEAWQWTCGRRLAVRRAEGYRRP
jgi:hypothetical protein